MITPNPNFRYRFLSDKSGVSIQYIHPNKTEVITKELYIPLDPLEQKFYMSGILTQPPPPIDQIINGLEAPDLNKLRFCVLHGMLANHSHENFKEKRT